MKFVPLDMMKDRVEAAKQDSDIAFFYDLLYLGEMMLKIVVSGTIASLVDDRDRHRHDHGRVFARRDALRAPVRLAAFRPQVSA